MNLILVRHGEAKSKMEDPSRPLTEEGIRKVERIADWLSKRAGGIAEIQHSGKKRAEQTAAIFAERLSPSRGVAAASGLKPNDDVEPIAEKLADQRDSLMIVGHLPFLSRLTSLLVAENPERETVRFPTAGVVCLVHKNERWAIAWTIAPDILAES